MSRLKYTVMVEGGPFGAGLSRAVQIETNGDDAPGTLRRLLETVGDMAARAFTLDLPGPDGLTQAELFATLPSDRVPTDEERADYLAKYERWLGKALR